MHLHFFFAHVGPEMDLALVLQLVFDRDVGEAGQGGGQHRNTSR